VLLFHGGITWMVGGFLGVDVFFVLSGFLITSLLLDEIHRTNTVGLGGFWSRRARRLLPAMLLVVAAVAISAIFVAPPGGFETLRRDGLATLFYVANWHFIADGASYFARTAAPSPLRHTWSLAIEEQFYLVWPLIVLLVCRGRGRLLKLGAVVAAGCAASVAAMVLLYHPGDDPSRVYYGTDARAHVVLAGAGLAVAVAAARHRGIVTLASRAARWLLAGAGVLAAAGIGWAMVAIDGNDTRLYQGGFAVVAAATAVVIAAVVLVPRSLPSRALSLWPLRQLGRISYGVYLWHWPVFLLMTHGRTHLEGWALFGARVAVTLALSVASYLLIETPVRRGWLPHWRALVALPVAVAAAVAVLFYGTVSSRAAKSVAAEPVGSTSATTSTTTLLENDYIPKSARPPRPAGQPVEGLILGDSVALTLGQGLAPYGAKYGVKVIDDGILGCGIVQGGSYRYFGQVTAQRAICDTWPTRWAGLVDRNDPDVVVVLVGRWEVMDRMRAGRWVHIGDPAFDQELRNDLDQAVTVLSRKGATVAFATAPYYLRGEAPDGSRYPEDDPARVDAFNVLVRSVAAAHRDRATVIDLNARTGPDGVYTRVVNGVVMRSDGVHFTPQGGKALAPWMLPQIEALGPPVIGQAPGAKAPSTTTTTIRRPARSTSDTTVLERFGTAARESGTTPTTVKSRSTRSTTTTTSARRTTTTTVRRTSTTSTTVRSSSTTSSTARSSTTTTTTKSTTTTTQPSTTTTTSKGPKPTLP
jgi:peptidoglycan/LPS O-acetylase OafA/YrhL